MENNIRTVYLAGGFRSRWQDKVINDCLGYEFIDPSLHMIEHPSDYTEWDLAAIERSDLVFAYMEESNPGGYALSLEIGYAKALGKKIIFCEDNLNETRRRHFSMVREVADYNFMDLDEAVSCLKKL